MTTEYQPIIRGRTAQELQEANRRNNGKSCGICERTYQGWCSKIGCPHRVERTNYDDQGW